MQGQTLINFCELDFYDRLRFAMTEEPQLCQCGCGERLQFARGVLRKFKDDTHRCRARKRKGKKR